MSDYLSLPELDDRIAQQEAALDKLVAQRDAMTKK